MASSRTGPILRRAPRRDGPKSTPQLLPACIVFSVFSSDKMLIPQWDRCLAADGVVEGKWGRAYACWLARRAPWPEHTATVNRVSHRGSMTSHRHTISR